MANKCYNTFSFFGNEKVRKQVEVWDSNLKKLSAVKTESYAESTIFEVFWPGETVQSAIPYLGSKWAYSDFGKSIALDAGELGFVSAWSAMDSFQDHLTQVLSKLDKNVVVLLSSSTEEYEESARYTALTSDGEIFSQSAELEYEDGDQKEDPNYTLFYEHQIDACSELIDEVPGAEPRLKKHLQQLDRTFKESLSD